MSDTLQISMRQTNSPQCILTLGLNGPPSLAQATCKLDKLLHAWIGYRSIPYSVLNNVPEKIICSRYRPCQLTDRESQRL